jgi:glutaminase
MHLVNHPGQRPTVTWLETDGSERHSAKPRSESGYAYLRDHGQAIQVRGLLGEIGFAAAERVMRSLGATPQPPVGGRGLVLDFSRVTSVHPTARELLEAFAGDLDEAGATVVSVDPGRRALIPGLREFASLDAALESCEDHLLRSA